MIYIYIYICIYEYIYMDVVKREEMDAGNEGDRDESEG